ncbi:UvrD-helicase domain-containing protein [uncultured Prevotella sp.]|uniref:UvrD-helicase domain-containing protein n=1 Tax=uncultured Prevotella sp. TaxID=159272 RepID=UPI0025EFE3FA|nr:UvrD-helicase domain-containing protein [uncultured Prevotella sp.]
MNTAHKALTVYKASAGSGKTFTLSVEYIKLLINDPTSFRSTLAVTFTNKATEEMKVRILSQLYGIWKRLPDSKSYIEKIKTDMDVTEEFMAERAGMALHNIVNNYSYFRIETIDSFFQSVLRNLARELDLTANLRVELNDYQIERNAVDDLIDNLSEDDQVLAWIMDYIHENLQDDKNWNVIGQIKKFGENIFREFYKTNSKLLNEKLLEEGFFKQYTSKLRSLRNEAEAEIVNEAELFFDILNNNGIDIQDLSYGKSGPAGYFVKIRSGVYDESLITSRVKTAMDNGNGDGWVKKTADAELKAIASSKLTPALINAEKTRCRNWPIYQSAVLTLRHLNQLRLLNSIENKVRDMNQEANRFLLSDTHTLLHSLIKDSDSPFIFEKIGTRLNNIMIDEFQDTSTVQWQNFKVLLEECMSHSSEQGNLIVGDVKQSIYRWRSGDWRMLNNIEREFPTMRNMLNVKSLDTNYRSSRRVINFNNTFFTQAAEIEYRDLTNGDELQDENTDNSAEQLKKAYSDVEQNVPDFRKQTGYVSVELLPQDDYLEQTLQKTADAVRELLEAGAESSDIAIIVRSNSTIQQLAEYFAEAMPDVRIVSDEAFRLDSADSVNIIVNAMHCLTHNDDKISRTYIAKAYQIRVLGKDNELVDRLLATEDGVNNALPKQYADNTPDLLAMPLYELAEKLYDIFGLKNIEGEDTYIYAFYDSLTDYLKNNTADIDKFVEEWDDSICSKTIQVNTTQGIRLITIHKSKGLEFENVIIPFCDWSIEKTNTIWCSPKVAPFNELPLVPVDFNAKQMKGTIFENDYNDEHLQNCVDNLNLLYVAFTRASQSLYVLAHRGNANQRSYTIEEAIANMELEGGILEGDPSDKKSIIKYTYGTLETADKKKATQSDNIFIPQVSNKNVKMVTYDSHTDFRQSNKSREFVCDEDDSNSEEKQRLAYIKTGRVLHHLFATINTTDDIEPSLKKLEIEGLIEDSNLTCESLRKMLHKRLENKQVADWFSGRWQLFNECTILDYDEATDMVKEHRPDRVMKDGDKVVIVDFKFGAYRPEYTDQVRRYISLTKGMGYEDVKGYLWFVYTNNIEEVKE